MSIGKKRQPIDTILYKCVGKKETNSEDNHYFGNSQ